MAKSSVDDASALRQQKQRRPSMAGPPSSASVRRTAFRNVRTKLGMAVVSLVLFAVIVWFVQTTSSAIMRSHDKKRLDVVLRMPSSTALAVLRTLQALLTIISSSALVGSFELLLWCLTARSAGLAYVRVLILSSATGVISTLRILCAPSLRLADRAWALLKVSLMACVWTAAVVLFFKTSVVTVYDTLMTYNVTAGVGPFNASYVQPYFDELRGLAPQYPYQVLPYSSFAMVNSLVADPTYSTVSTPVACAGDGCSSYLLSGGLVMTTPWVPMGYGDHPMVKVDDVPSIQLDFDRAAAAAASFADADCSVYGSPDTTIGVRLCLRTAGSSPGRLLAGLFVCQNGTAGGACGGGGAVSRPNMTTAMTMYSRRAAVQVSTSNYNIMDVSRLSRAVALPAVDLAAYGRVMDWLLNYTATNIPAPSSVAENFWATAAVMGDPMYDVVLQRSFQSMLAFPVWMFNANNYGNPALQARQIVAGLPPDFYTAASIVTPYEKLRINRSMFATFAVLQGTGLLFVWGVLAWALWAAPEGLPSISSYALFDSMFKLRLRVTGDDDVLAANNWRILQLARETQSYAHVEPGDDGGGDDDGSSGSGSGSGSGVRRQQWRTQSWRKDEDGPHWAHVTVHVAEQQPCRTIGEDRLELQPSTTVRDDGLEPRPSPRG